MATPELTYAFYAETHRGALGEDALLDALPLATARLVALTGDDVPERCETAWLHALCALCDTQASVGGAHRGISSEHVGNTTLNYTAEAAEESDYAVALPWLAGTGLLYAGLCRCGGGCGCQA